jgi:uncharacterized coiled-coil protein SlyX/signal recognition particle subunit SEC65
MAKGNASGGPVAGARESASEGDWDASGKTAPGMEEETTSEEPTEDAEPEVEGEESEAEPEAEPEQEEAEGAEEGEEEGAEEGTEEEGEEAEPGEEEADAEQDERIAELTGQIAQQTKLMEYYEKQNSVLTQRLQQLVATVQKGAAKVPPAGAVPGIPKDLEPPPANWETTNDLVSYFDKRTGTMINQHVENTLRKGYQDAIMPAFNRFNTALHSIIERAVKPQLKDFDDVLGEVTKSVFLLDSKGEKIVGVQNQQLLNYFRAQPVPLLAMYDYGMSRRAPKQIKKATNEAVKKAVKKLGTRPKAPVVPKGKAKPKGPIAELDWNTPRRVAEGILAKKRLI